MTDHTIILAEGGLPFPPGVDDFYLPPLVEGAYPWLTKFTLLIVLAVLAISAFFLIAYRKPTLVPSKGQWMAESIYGFARNNVGQDMIGHRGIAFAPYFTTLLCFVLLTNLFGIIPFIQLSPNSHIAFPAILAVISYVMFIYVGVKQHGLLKFLKNSTMPPAPWYMMPLLIPIEIFSNLISRPFTLALRLFANMFAGHMILLVFMLGGFAMINASPWLAPISLLSWAMAIALTFLEVMVAALQAYVFVVLTASYISSALADEH